MRAHQRHGYDCNDVVNYGMDNYRRRNRLTWVTAIHLNGAASMRNAVTGDQAARFRAGDYRTVDDFKRLARRDAMKAREWRLELQGAL